MSEEPTAERTGYIVVLGDRNNGWRSGIIDPADSDPWFYSAKYDSRDACLVTAMTWAIHNDIKLVPEPADSLNPL
jgi:hypothetical protein